MTRRPLRTLALPIALTVAAAAAAPASADGVTLDTSFGTGGFAFTDLGAPVRLTTPVTTEGPGGVLASAVTVREQDLRDRGDGGSGLEGLTITQHSAAGVLLDRDFFDLGDRWAGVTDVRKLADGRVIAVGDAYEGTSLWFRIVGADGAPQGGGEFYRPKGCWGLADAVVHPSGQIVAAWRCEDRSPIQVLHPDDAGDETRIAAVQGPVVVDQPVDDLALDPEGRVVLLSTAQYVEREIRAQVGRITIGDRTYALDATFGEDGWADTAGMPWRVTADGKSRPVTLGYDWEQGSHELNRLEADGDPDPTFDGDGHVSYADGRIGDPAGLGTDRRNRVLIATWLLDDYTGRALVRLTEDGRPDAELGENGVMIIAQDDRTIGRTGDPVGVAGGTVLPLGFDSDDAVPSRRIAVPAEQGRGILALMRLGDPVPPQPQQTTTTATSQSAPSAGLPKLARTCLSRRSFTIRVRPAGRKLVSATVKVAGRKAKVTRKNGRLTATIDLRKLKQATFNVSVVAKDAKGRTYRESRRYRTCRVGQNGPKVKGGSTVITVGR